MVFALQPLMNRIALPFSAQTVENCLVQCHRIYQTRLPDNRGGVTSSVEEAVRCCQLIIRHQTERLVQLYNV